MHVGLHKTGTTWLQRLVFVADAGPFAAFDKGPKGPIAKHIVAPNGLDFDADVARAAFAPQLEELAERGLVPVVSSERLSGHPYSGGYDSRQLAERLAAVFPDARVLLVVREQGALILSNHRQYARYGGTWPVAQYVSPPVPAARLPLFDPRFFAYDRLLRTYRELFGDDRVLCLPYELLPADPAAFAQEITAFAGAQLRPEALAALRDAAPANVGLSAASTRLLRAANRLVARTDVNPSPLVASTRATRWARAWAPRADRVVPAALERALDRRDREAVRAAIAGRYADSNARLAELTGRDLAALGYEVGSAPVGAERVGQPG